MKEMKHNENQNQRRNIDFKKRISMTDLYSKEEIEKWIPIELKKKNQGEKCGTYFHTQNVCPYPG